MHLPTLQTALDKLQGHLCVEKQNSKNICIFLKNSEIYIKRNGVLWSNEV